MQAPNQSGWVLPPHRQDISVKPASEPGKGSIIAIEFTSTKIGHMTGHQASHGQQAATH